MAHTLMPNRTLVTQIRLAAYYDVGHLKALYVVVVSLLYVLIFCSNVVLISAVVLHRTLHRPMYSFLCVLFLNELYGGTCVAAFVLVQILNEDHVVSVPLCLLQVFQIYSYVSVEFTNLAVISYDRYVAICFPLQYNARMSLSRVRFLVVLIWLPPLVAVGVTTLLTASLTLCGNDVHKVYCDNYSIVKLSCFDTAANNWYELVAASVTVICPLVVIFFTYVQILRVCFSGGKQTRQKAVSTCTPHLCSLLNFAFGVSFEVVQTRFDTHHLPPMLTAFLPFYLLMCQPLFNPLMYGLALSQIRLVCKSLVLRSSSKVLSH